MEDLTINELKHLLSLQGLWYQNGCTECDIIRKKLETMIAERQAAADKALGIAGREYEHVGGSNTG
ncbi:MAG: hypothetical protein WC428_08465 [Candidatus Paceibacterota bacterium]|jgi:hypothetical protein